MRRTTLLSLGLFLTGCATYHGTPVTTQMMSDEYLHQFVRESCGFTWEEKYTVPEEKHRVCSRKWADRFASRLQEKYPHANIDDIAKRCDTYPRACEPRRLEQWAQDQEEEMREPAVGLTDAPKRAPACTNLSTPCD